MVGVVVVVEVVVVVMALMVGSGVLLCPGSLAESEANSGLPSSCEMTENTSPSHTRAHVRMHS